MPIQIPKLDDRSFDDLVEELLALVPAHTPEWTPRLGDPGRTLIELFAWLTDTLLYRANLIPERQRLAFLRLLGIPLRPAIPASGTVQVFWASPDEVRKTTLRSLAQIKGPAPFETRSELTVFPVTATAFYKRRLSEAEAIQLAGVVDGLQQIYQISGSAMPYVTTPVFAEGQPVAAGLNLMEQAVDGTLWLALLAAKPEQVAVARQALGDPVNGSQPILNVGITPAIALPESLTNLPVRTQIPHVWEMTTGQEFDGAAEYLQLDRLEDTTQGLRQAGIVRLAMPATSRIGAPSNDVRTALNAGVGDRPPRLDQPDLAARLVTWLRLRPTVELTQLSLSWVGINAVTIDQRQTRRGLVIGISDGSPTQAFQLPGTSVESSTLELQIEVPNGGYQPWIQVEDLALVGRDTPAYSLDSEAGLIQFGDGVNGRIPEREVRIRVAQMRAGGGELGNLPPGALTEITALDGQENRVNGLSLRQSQPTQGGTEAETLEAAEQRIPALFRHRDRAVTQSDYRQLAADTPGISLGRVAVLPRFKPQQRRQGVPGVVSVVVLPQKDALQPPNPRPDRPTLEAVHAYLDDRRPLGTELYVIGVEYVPLAVSVGVQVQDGGDRDRTLQAVREALYQFLWPLAPGDVDSTGWSLGKSVRDRDLEVIVARVSGIQSVLGLTLFEQRQNRWQPLPEKFLDPWQLPELLTVVAVADAAPPERIEDPTRDRPGGLAVPVVPEVC
ncbi:MAG: putative baseplate assembly protein [Leptolyngbya sp. SIO1E4]|nr:putative baseplate assembly protein [Leptolyngbya sp. SIO1E4]